MKRIFWLVLLAAGAAVYLTATSEQSAPADSTVAVSDSTAVATDSTAAPKLAFSWRSVPMNNTRTGCRAAAVDDVSESLGTMSGSVYVAPNGRKFRSGCTPVVAKILLEAQPRMARLKEVIATSTREMVRE